MAAGSNCRGWSAKKIVGIKWNEDNTTQEAVDENEDETAGAL